MQRILKLSNYKFPREIQVFGCGRKIQQSFDLFIENISQPSLLELGLDFIFDLARVSYQEFLFGNVVPRHVQTQEGIGVEGSSHHGQFGTRTKEILSRCLEN